MTLNIQITQLKPLFTGSTVFKCVCTPSWEVFCTFQPLPYRRKVVSLSKTHLYFPGRSSGELLFLIPPVETFTACTHYATYTEPIRFHNTHSPLERSKTYLQSFFSRNVEIWNDCRGVASAIRLTVN